MNEMLVYELELIARDVAGGMDSDMFLRSMEASEKKLEEALKILRSAKDAFGHVEVEIPPDERSRKVLKEVVSIQDSIQGAIGEAGVLRRHIRRAIERG